jgi:hypothetical protein
MRRALITFGYVCFGIALLGLGSALFGKAGIWGFLAFLIGSIAGGFWILIGFVVGKATKVGEILLPSTPEAKLRRRLFRASLRSVVRSEAGSAADLLHRLEYVWESIRSQLADRLVPGELTYHRYEEAARKTWRRALLELEDATDLIESLAALSRRSGPGKYDSRPGSGTLSVTEQHDRLQGLLRNGNQAVSALERLNLALVGELRTGSAKRSEDLDALASELDQLARRAHRFADSA